MKYMIQLIILDGSWVTFAYNIAYYTRIEILFSKFNSFLIIELLL